MGTDASRIHTKPDSDAGHMHSRVQLPEAQRQKCSDHSDRNGFSGHAVMTSMKRLILVCAISGKWSCI